MEMEASTCPVNVPVCIVPDWFGERNMQYRVTLFTGQMVLELKERWKLLRIVFRRDEKAR